MKIEKSLDILCFQVVTKKHLITLKVDADTLAEFAAAAAVFRARSVSSFLHQYVVGQINEAKKMVNDDAWRELVAEHKRATEERSKLRAEVRKRSLNGIPIAPTGSKIKLGKLTQEKKLKTR